MSGSKDHLYFAEEEDPEEAVGESEEEWESENRGGFPTMSSIKAMLQDFSAPKKRRVDDHGNNLLTVVDTSGMHILATNIAHGAVPKEGNLAYFCLACSQPGINLPENWIEDLQGAWKYNRSFVMDGNFSAKHMKMKVDIDFDLIQGSGYFTTVPRHKKHLQIADDVESISRKYIQVVKALDIAEDSYKNLTANAEEAVILKWISQAKDTQSRCITNVTAMDIFDVQLKQDEVIIQEAGSDEEWQEEHMLSLPSNIGPTQCQDTGMVALGASPAMLEKYQVLKPEHLESRTIEINPSMRGTHGKNLPWFWRLNVNMKEDNWMSELLRVKFHCARANLTQCKEEVELLETEIQWSANFFQYHADKWKKLATEAGQK
ncbi:hypothetical protein BS17DRAFT_765141 [Gyrodon lividus]|nr:hypothetical protein BS17DRAFT_765141 [Gyrodon lividus]